MGHWRDDWQAPEYKTSNFWGSFFTLCVVGMFILLAMEQCSESIPDTMPTAYYREIGHRAVQMVGKEPVASGQCQECHIKRGNK